ncbi:putative quinol monooxygenase [Rhizobium jaguaris]|uniref:putative quinol monooxygenase n=1 Tax=Rhizobium jaguaris TaxID=1312183 RepID=UPI0039BF6EA8
MPNLVVLGTIEAVAGHREQLIPLLKAHRARCLRDERGTLSFDIMTSNDDDAKIYIHEVYQDAAAFELHLNSPSIKQWREETAGLVAKVLVQKATPVE